MMHTRRDPAIPALASVVLAGGMIAVAVAGAAVARAETGSTATATPMPSPATPNVSPDPSSVAARRFSTPIPPDTATTWTGIDWRQVAPDDPLALVRSVLRWRGGFVALGEEVMAGQAWRTPVWVSDDGATWVPIGADVFGPATIVLGVGEVPDGLVALTLASGTDQCGDEPVTLSCLTLAAPLESWTSPDATSWTAHPGPADIAPPVEGCAECGVDVPMFRSGPPGLLALDTSRTSTATGSRMALSTDGITWENVPDTAFPTRFDFHDVVASGSGFLATGERGVTVGGNDTIRAVVLSSGDGRTWVRRKLPTTGLRSYPGGSAGRIVAGPDGLIVVGSEDGVPGRELWWSKVTGQPWSRLTGYPPLGTWTGDGEGSGLLPDGTLVGDGERLLAYRGGVTPTGWTSLDGRSWQPLDVSGAGPTSAGNWPLQTLGLTPIGVLAASDDGTKWFGVPRT